MVDACKAIDIAWTVFYWLVIAALSWQTQRRILRLKVHSTEKLYLPQQEHDDGDQKAVPKWFPAFSWHDARDLYGSRIFRKHGPLVLAGWHLFVFAGVSATIAVEWAGGRHGAPYDNYGAYLTNWTFFLLGFRALFGIFVCLDGQRRLHHRKKSIGTGGPVMSGQEPYNFGHVVYAILTAIMPTAACAVAIGYWAAIRNPENLTWEEPIKHGANALVLLIEIAISRLPMTTTWLLFPVGYTCLYTIFMIIFHKIDGVWVYRRTNVDKCINIIGYVVAPIIVTVVFFVLYGLTKLRNRIQRRLFDRSHAGKDAASSHESQHSGMRLEP